jgi:3'-phosphoadenosine 5'-phosphosulfate sulfotransferase (PAPS reductase)/FAD synthetase
VVGDNSASRDGAPFRDLITQRSFLPNPVKRFCTTELKIRPIKQFAMRELGWEHWVNIIGLRYDEPSRVAKLNNHKERWETVAPLFTARITKREVATFWKTQAFDLKLRNVNGVTPEGNCDPCFLKRFPTMMGLIRAEPWRADWWALMEKTVAGTTQSSDTARFRKDRPSYAAMQKATFDQSDIFADDEDLTECYCHD